MNDYSDIQELVKKEISDALAVKAHDDSFGVPLAVPSHNHTGEDSTAVLYANLTEIQKFIMYRIVNNEIPTAVDTTVGGDFVMPFEGYITEVGATVDTAGTTGTMTIDINKGGTSILDTKITLDTTEKTSRTGATGFVFADDIIPTFEIGDIFTFDVDGVHTTPATGLTIYMKVIHTP